MESRAQTSMGSRSFKARMQRELAVVQVRKDVQLTDRPKQKTLKIAGLISSSPPRSAYITPRKPIVPCRSSKTLQSAKPTISKVAACRPLPAVPPELRKLQSMLKGVSPLPVPRLQAKEVREFSASPISDLVTSSELEEPEDHRPLRSLSEKKVGKQAPQTIAVYTEHGLRMYELRRVNEH